jgi:hypothetical protein
MRRAFGRGLDVMNTHLIEIFLRSPLPQTAALLAYYELILALWPRRES